MAIKYFSKNLLHTIFKEKFRYPILIVILGNLFFWKVFLFPSYMVFGKDLFSIFSYHKFLASNSLHTTGELPLWDPYSFSGTPFLGHGQEGFFYPFSILFYLFPSDSMFGFFYIIHCVIAGLGTYFLMRNWGFPPFASFVSGLTYMFSLKFMSGVYAGHVPFVAQAAWIPFVFLFLHLTIEKGKYLFAFIAGITLSIAYLAGHIQLIFYLSFLLFVYFCFLIFPEFLKSSWKKCLKALYLFCLIFVVFIGLSSIQILPLLEVKQYILRGEGTDYVSFQNHLRPKDLIRLFLPHFYGSPYNHDKPGFVNHILETTLYVGWLPLILSVIAVLKPTKRSFVFFWFGISIFIVVFGMGKHTPIYPFFHSYIPGFGYFRGPPRMLWFLPLSISILAGVGASLLIIKLDSRGKAIVRWVLVGLTIISIFVFVSTQYLNQADFGNWFLITVLLSTLFIIYHKFRTNWVSGWPKVIGKSLVILVILFDLSSYGTPYIIMIDQNFRVFNKTISVSLLEQIENPFRALDFAGEVTQKISGRYGIQNLNGYGSSILRHYSEIYGLIWDRPNFPAGINSMPLFPIEQVKNKELLNLLNTRFIITDRNLKIPNFKLFYKSGYFAKDNKIIPVFIYENQEVLPRTFVVRNAIVVKEKEDIFQELKNFDPTKTIILEENIKQKHFQGNFQPALITSYHPNRISIEVNLKNPGFLFLGDIWFPGWKAFDNGKEKKVMKANYAFRSVFLEPGEHRVEFVYDPLSYKIGKIISLLTLFLLLTYGFFAWKRKKELNF